MDFLRFAQVVHSGLSSGLWGLACPFYCQPSSLPTLGLAFVLGWLCGIFCTLLATWWLCSLPVAPGTASQSSPSSRLGGYLHAGPHY